MKCCEYGPRVLKGGPPPSAPGSRAPKDKGYIRNKKQWKKILYTENTYLGGRLGATTFSIPTLSITTFSINDTQHNSTLSVIMLNVTFYSLLC